MWQHRQIALHRADSFTHYSSALCTALSCLLFFSCWFDFWYAEKLEKMPEPRSPMASFAQSVQNAIDGPITWFRETIVEPNQEKYKWYHQSFRRVPTIDQCYTDDAVCRFEADQQFRRDRMVDNEIVNILRQRFEDCMLYEAPDHMVKCKPLLEQYNKATENWFIKYGDLGGYANAKTAFMKQKHRLIWERRHGPVGSGMKEDDHKEEVEEH